ncbi:DUF3892 domain-containing protein [Amycolatopsis sp. cmx-11-12]|uniref:DUF3892 domain-containing protein n=1 Tax=Amycolatopsis sp. cmx-11-12 TaxID=2785795 RepID=UPI003917E399
MTDYRIVCTDQTGCTTGGHITAVGTGADANSASQRFTVQQVYNLMNNGNTFHTYGAGRRADVHKWDCACGVGTLRSSADSTTANNLDNLRICTWK